MIRVEYIELALIGTLIALVSILSREKKNVEETRHEQAIDHDCCPAYGRNFISYCPNHIGVSGIGNWPKLGRWGPGNAWE
jgi:hypothetical protein